MPTQKWIAVTAVLTIALASLAGTSPAGAASESDVYARGGHAERADHHRPHQRTALGC